MFDKLSNYKRAVLFFSGGKESTLLLSMMREQPIDFDIITQGMEWWTKEQRSRVENLIRDWKLKVFSYPPMSSHLAGELSLVSYYAMGTTRIPMYRDFVGEGERCLSELNGQKLNVTPFNWDLYIFGSREDDTHPLQENLMPAKEWTEDGITFWNPLYDWTRDEVESELDMRGLNFEDTDETNTGNLVNFCTNCVKGTEDVWCPKDQKMIPSIVWR